MFDVNTECVSFNTLEYTNSSTNVTISTAAATLHIRREFHSGYMHDASNRIVRMRLIV